MTWLQTYTGKAIDIRKPDPASIDILDIAHALSNQCRFSGHVKRFYSVAEHSWHLSMAADPDIALWALLHDASEAYIVDIPRPLKPFLPEYKLIERRFMRMIAHRFNLVWPCPDEIHSLDSRIILNERDALLSDPPKAWEQEDLERLPGLEIRNYLPEVMERLFLYRAESLGIEVSR